MTTFAIVGAGNAGCAFAAHLKLLGHEVRLYDAFEQQLSAIQDAGNTIEFGGNVSLPGTGTSFRTRERIDYVGSDLKTAVAGADLILCTAPAHAHRLVARELATCVAADQIVVLNPGRTCGAIEVQQVLKEQGAPDGVVVVEAQTLLYACRRNGAAVHVFGVKERVSCAAVPPSGLSRFLSQMQPVLPQFVEAEQGIWQTSLDNIGMLFHPVPTLMNLGRMESGDSFDYYHDGMSPTIAAQVEKLDAERIQVAEAMGVQIPTVTEWLRITYGAEGTDLFHAIQNNASYKGISAPKLNGPEAKLGLRYIIEDVPTGLVPVSELGRRLGVPTPTIDLMISLAGVIYERDFRAEGRTLERLGLAGMDVEQLRALGNPSAAALHS